MDYLLEIQELKKEENTVLKKQEKHLNSQRDSNFINYKKIKLGFYPSFFNLQQSLGNHLL